MSNSNVRDDEGEENVMDPACGRTFNRVVEISAAQSEAPRADQEED